jgi:hypothetical protein
MLDMDEFFELPAKPFFSCDADGFSVVDGQQMRNTLDILSIEPALKLHVGPGNVFEHTPRRIVSSDGRIVEVACDDEVTVVLDFEEMRARKSGPGGEFWYMGDIEDGNDAKGWLPAR